GHPDAVAALDLPVPVGGGKDRRLQTADRRLERGGHARKGVAIRFWSAATSGANLPLWVGTECRGRG
ncbi:MAG: hypothetical protein ACNA71_10655, partial [Kiritimatiellia bacterium]